VQAVNLTLRLLALLSEVTEKVHLLAYLLTCMEQVVVVLVAIQVTLFTALMVVEVVVRVVQLITSVLVVFLVAEVVESAAIHQDPVVVLPLKLSLD
jgi:hypothetical protein